MQKKNLKLFLKSIIKSSIFPFFGILSLESLLTQLKKHPAGEIAWNYLHSWYEQDSFQRETARKITLMMAALPYPNQGPDKNPVYPFGKIAPFARSHYYREMMNRLKRLSLQIREHFNMSKVQVRLFCNSRFPEKSMAWAMGMGFIGRNSLLIHPQEGSSFVLGGMIIDHESGLGDDENPEPLKSLCAQCQLCVKACPSGAITVNQGLKISSCLQYQATSLEIWPDNIKLKWQNRFYGCEVCQKVCPYYQKIPGKIDHYPGYLGALINLHDFLHRDSLAIKAFFKKTALGLSWIPQNALIRNALIALQGQDLSSLKKQIHFLSQSRDPVVSDAASWILDHH